MTHIERAMREETLLRLSLIGAGVSYGLGQNWIGLACILCVVFDAVAIIIAYHKHYKQEGD